MVTKKAEKPKKIVVLGVGPEHQAFYEETLLGHKVKFAVSIEEAFTAGMKADVLAVNIDKHSSFISSMLERGSEAKVVAIATSRERINKLVKHPGGTISPVCLRNAPWEIRRLLAV